MDINPQIHLTTGQFAKLMRVSKDTLFHYDKLQIFSPEFIAENGYRYYSIYQSEVFYVITTLKELGMSLKEIKEYLNHKSPKEFISLLDKQADNLDKKIQHLKKVQNMIKQKSKLTKEAMKINTSVITFEERQKERFIVTEAKAITDEKNIYDSIFQHIDCLMYYKINTFHLAGWMIDTKNIFDGKLDYYDYLFTRVTETGYSNFTAEKGTYLVAYHTAGYTTISDSFKKIIEYAQSNNVILEGYFYEDILLDDLSVQGYEKYLIKLSVKVKH
ncbi:MerR family transcriptional regulator [Alkalihalobacillus sp. LMS39]|uniref:MerR family transcriptional regulator n=1 Tax=Alkalihalobacillus sp. LMS39 TaxID=2924032 RepID=UPI001FB56AB7|nr:MerR family transcriptional regulator [Alkalihalobacillus sp. LMS39]UOE95291.1 MerR family transcriptional regulator [Alkalihalobacillus sp. LMS39]